MSACKLESKVFFDAIENGELIGSRCTKCGKVSLPQRYICSACYSSEAERINFKGTGTLAAFTVIYVPATEMAAAGYNSKNPYCVGIVALDEGPRISAQIVGLDLAKPGEIKIGMPLKMTTIERGAEDQPKIRVMAFEPV